MKPKRIAFDASMTLSGQAGAVGLRPGKLAVPPSDCRVRKQRNGTARFDSTGEGLNLNPAPFNILNALQAVNGLLSVGQLAQLFGKSNATIYRMAQKRQIPSLMFGGSRMFDPSTLIIWLIKKDPQLAVAARQFQLAA